MENRQSVIDANSMDGDEKARFTFLLPAELKAQLEAACASQSVACSALIRELLDQYMRRHRR